MTHREVLHSLLHGDTGMPLYAHEVKALTAAIAALDEIDGIRRIMLSAVGEIEAGYPESARDILLARMTKPDSPPDNSTTRDNRRYQR